MFIQRRQSADRCGGVQEVAVSCTGMSRPEPRPGLPVRPGMMAIEAGDGDKSVQGKRILVVDDNVDAANSMAEILRLLGHETFVEYDGLAAVSAVTRLQPDVALMDIGLPGIDGYEAARRIRALDRGKELTLIALTGWGQDKDRDQAVEAGFNVHWVKPVSFEKLQAL